MRPYEMMVLFHPDVEDHKVLAEEIGETGIRILTAIKRELDPQGILNPGAVIGRGVTAHPAS